MAAANFRGELCGDGFLDEEPVRGGAGLAHVPHLGSHGPFDGLVQVGVLEHDERGVPAQFHGGPQDVLAASAIRRLPTGVEPVKETFRRRESFSSGPEIPEATGGGDDVQDSGGQAGVEHGLREQYCAVSGVSLAGLRTMVQPAATAGATLRVAMASGKFHGVMSRHGPDGFVLDQDLVLALGGGEVAAVVADGFLGEPAQELGAVGDFAAGFGQGFAHFQGHQQREVLGAFGDQVEGAAQDLGPDPGRGPRPGRLDRRRRRRARRRRPRWWPRRGWRAPPRWRGRGRRTCRRRTRPAIARRSAGRWEQLSSSSSCNAGRSFGNFRSLSKPCQRLTKAGGCGAGA
jgi:hypothetical protein